MTKRFAAALVFLAWVGLRAQDTARMDQVVRYYVDQKQFMGSVLVARGGQVLFHKAFGSANLEWDIPNTPDTKFRLGSITKQFTAACILLLEERGKLKLEDPVKKHLAEAPAAWDKVTIHHLLTHTSGIPSFTGFPDYKTLKMLPTTPEKMVAVFRDKPLEFQPGEKWAYSNSGYLLLGYLIEKIGGVSYEKFLRQNVLDPLEMKETGYDSNSALLAKRASGYTPRLGGILVNADYIDMTIPHAAGALYSTTGNLLRWTQGLFGGKLLKPESLARMTTPFKDNYALGVGVRTVRGRKVVDHGGGIEGFNTMLAYYPDDKLTVIALSNLNGPGPGQIVSRLAAVAQGDPVALPSERKEISVSPKVLEMYVGSYELRPGFVMTVTLEDGKLMTQATGQQKIQVFALSETKFFPKVVDAEIEFLKDEKGAVTHLILNQGGRAMKAPRK